MSAFDPAPDNVFDIVVVGAGPAGLCFANALAGNGLSVALVERQSRETLADPADDGREIALTHRSQRIMGDLGLWARLPADHVADLREALVLDGDDPHGLRFAPEDGHRERLGWLVSNHAIRRAAYAECEARAAATLLCGRRTVSVSTACDGVSVTLDDGSILRASLLVAADSRFSETRRAVGIAAAMRDFGRTMLVCRMRHARPHAATAWEWFDHGQTLALLPLRDPQVSSVVLTVPQLQAQALQALAPEAFAEDMARRFHGRLGAMEVIGPCCAYPLVGVYPQAFVAERFAAIGDAAVGMHPVTAHGFNFGLLGQDALASAIRRAHAAGRPFWSMPLLQAYERGHRRATRPLYLATTMIASLYTDDSPSAKVLRRAALRVARHAAPFRRAVTAGLTGEAEPPRLVSRAIDGLQRLRQSIRGVKAATSPGASGGSP
ncbi:MAG: 5-demethoxyubiquinol-8 5-hydroxylase UbiM [Lysobacter sp.]|nr:5-demethoxyubiquinol-8 5-hydroxylase UbiM [Lysobacter sp.]